MIIDEFKSQNAISIVALVITIILLIIIASISISQLSGQDGLLSRSKTSVSAYKEKAIKEKVELKIADLNLEKLEQNSGELTLQDILNLKNTDEEITNSYESGNSVVLVLNNEYKCEINEDFEVGSIETYTENKAKLVKMKRTLTVDTSDIFEREEQ